jgi:hypothetical protein
MSLLISSVFTYDEDAGNYIQAVETADAQALEPATRKAINNFVIGCKQDGIWTAIKASCILAGARTLAGALVPLVGTAPTNNGFVGIGTDYVRKTGLVGDGSTKYLNSNRNNNADPQNSQHMATYVYTTGTGTSIYMGAGVTSTESGVSNLGISSGQNNHFFRNRFGSAFLLGSLTATGLMGTSRSASTGYTARIENVNTAHVVTSESPYNGALCIFAGTEGNFKANARLAFYSIGESLDLARLDGRVTELINAFAVTIP